MGFIPGIQGGFNSCKLINVVYPLINWRKESYGHQTDAEKESAKIQHSFLIKTSNKVGTERLYLNIIKAIYDKPSQH